MGLGRAWRLTRLSNGAWARNDACVEWRTSDALARYAGRWSVNEVSTMGDRGRVVRSGSVEGELFETIEDFVGWAWDSDRPNDSVMVELVINGEVIATTQADRDADARMARAEPTHRSFRFRAPPLPAFVFPVEMSIRIAGVDVCLGSRRFERPRDAAPFMDAFPVGHTDGLRDGVLVGWAVDLSHPDRVASVEVFVDGSRVARVPCSGPRLDLADAGIPSTNAGFSYVVPRSLIDGRSHSIAVRFASTGELLPNGSFVIGVSADSAIVSQLVELSNRIAVLEREVEALRSQSFERFDSLLALRFLNLENELKAAQRMALGSPLPGR
jgi:hypothetical protein